MLKVQTATVSPALSALHADQFGQHLVRARQYAGRINMESPNNAPRVDQRNRAHGKPCVGIEYAKALGSLAMRIKIRQERMTDAGFIPVWVTIHPSSSNAWQMPGNVSTRSGEDHRSATGDRG